LLGAILVNAVACAAPVVQQKPQTIDLSAIEPVSSRLGVGHVCPVTEKLALTATHVEGWRSVLDPPTKTTPIPLMGEIDGQPITLFRLWTDLRRDISMVQIVGPEKFPRFYPLAKKVPEPGTKLWIRWFDIYKGFEGKEVEVEVMRTDFGNLYLKKEPEGYVGSSGSCMLNEDEEVVAIYVSSYPRRSGLNSVEWMGDGELVAGPWGTYHRDFVEGR
jgi:hypothetical protein